MTSSPEALRRLPSLLLERAAARGGRLLTDELAECGVRRRHYLVLAAIAECGPVAQAELGRQLDIDGSDMVAVLNELEERALVVRARDDRDRRRNAITLSAEGGKVLRRLDRLVGRANDRLLAALSDAERGQLVALLARVAERTDLDG
ncbi:MarR family transcriptional regulator [Solihabitans fulvus]|uniref:MarR family transcriptional regulator n=1 Tax=Solihabitans fulvus TaxID=1892852 RepID=A0A5B2XVZ3_9PSEU|nr:MarR family transcriptional regulator [Solihabitans fulvus]KAA2267029.1 MarR family transcriptional regulator [Solihabitans fulvus]